MSKSINKFNLCTITEIRRDIVYEVSWEEGFNSFNYIEFLFQTIITVGLLKVEILFCWIFYIVIVKYRI